MGVPTKQTNAPAVVMPKGTYPGVVVGAGEDYSKASIKKYKDSGREEDKRLMLTLELEVYGPTTKQLDYFVVYTDEQGQITWRVDNVTETLIEPEHDKPLEVDGQLPVEHLIGRNVMVEIEHEDDSFNGRDRKREKVKRLVRHKDGPVSDWKPGQAPATAAAPQSTAEFMGVADEDLPFDKPYFA